MLNGRGTVAVAFVEDFSRLCTNSRGSTACLFWVEGPQFSHFRELHVTNILTRKGKLRMVAFDIRPM